MCCPCVQQVHRTENLQPLGHLVKSYCTEGHDKRDAISVYNFLKIVFLLKACFGRWLESPGYKVCYTTVSLQAKGNRQATPLSLAVALWDRVSTVNSDDEVYKLAVLR